MDWNIRRNYKERQELWRKAQELDRAKLEAFDAIPDELDDDEYNAEFDRIREEYDSTPLYTKLLALEYRECRNDWFRNFVKSFGVCESKRISYKQAQVMLRYSEQRHEYRPGRGMDYYVRVGNLFVKTQDFGNTAYITITELI